MKPALVALLILCAAPSGAATSDPFPAATPESQGMSAQSLATLLEVARGFAEKGDIVGGELLVIKNRRTVLHAAVGLGDLEAGKPLSRDTIYCIRSMTKPIMGAAVQMLIDEGRLSLDDQAARYLPSFDNDKSRAITVRQLLTHTGGLPLSTLITRNFQDLASLREVVDISAKNGPTIPPGSGFQYSDDGTDALGAIVESITRQPAEVFITRRILEPLGMRDTFPLVSQAGKKRARFTPAYSGNRGNWLRIATPADKPLFPYFLASQGMYSTTRDYARFLALYLDRGKTGGKRLLSDAAIRRTLEPANITGFPDGFSTLTTHYGQLMMNYVDADKKVVAFGHGGSDGTHAYAWPEHDLMVLFYTQSRGNTTSLDLEAAIDRLLLGAKQTAPAVQDVTAAASLPNLGVYWLEPVQRPMIMVLHNDRLALEIPWRGLVELNKSGEEHVWSFKEAPDNSVKFHREGNGPATAFDLRGGRTMTLQRFEPEKGLPALDDLLKRRPDAKRAEKLAALGTIRMTGSVDITAGSQKGTFEMISSGEDHLNLTLNVGGRESRQIVAGRRAWARYDKSMPAQILPDTLAQAARLNGWLLATGDWHDDFAQANVLKRVDLDGKPVFLVLAAPALGRQRLIYVDAETGLTLGYDEVQDVPGLGLVGCEVRFADFRDIEGVRIPFRSTVKFPTPMLGTFTYQVEKIETRQEPGEDPFAFR